MKRTLKQALRLTAAVGCGVLATRLLKSLNGPSFRNHTVMISGGARGLGLELARLFCREGAHVALCSRSEDDVNAAVAELRASGGYVFGQVCDVRDRTQVREWAAAVLERCGTIDVLVNNAGVIQVGPADCMTLEDYRNAMDTHFWGPLSSIEAVVPAMRRQGGGRIVNIASIGGKIAVPHLVPYDASKFALVGLSTGLHAELARHGINVTTVCPGLMRTGSPRNALFKGRHRAEYAWFSISSSIPGATMPSRAAARRILEACRRGDAEVILSIPAKIAARFYALFSNATAALLSGVNRLLPTPGGIESSTAHGFESFSAWSPSPLTRLSDEAAIANNEVPRVLANPDV